MDFERKLYQGNWHRSFNTFQLFYHKKNEEEGISINQDETNSAYFFKQYHIDSDYKLSVCANSNQFPHKVILKI